MQADATLGVQMRYDDIDVGLFNTDQRNIVSTIRTDHVGEGSVGIYGQDTIYWTDWFRSTAGLREDLFFGSDHSDNPLNSGSTNATLTSPKLGLVFGPFAKTEYFVNAGTGFHSNDFRGTVISVDPSTGEPLGKVPLLVRSKGAEIGVRTQAIPKLETTLSAFVLDFDSELVFSGDDGTDEPSGPTRRIGFELANRYKPLPWLTLDLDLSMTQARYTNHDPAGTYVPEAAGTVIDAAVTIDNLGPWFGDVRLRYFGPRALTQDDSVRSKSTALVSASAGYKLSPSLRISADIFNLFNTKASQIDYFYATRLPGEPSDGVNDINFKPVEPTNFRITLTKLF
jgi:outer membrane receptor protein involved in Fe transport